MWGLELEPATLLLSQGEVDAGEKIVDAGKDGLVAVYR